MRDKITSRLQMLQEQCEVCARAAEAKGHHEVAGRHSARAASFRQSIRVVNNAMDESLTTYVDVRDIR